MSFDDTKRFRIWDNVMCPCTKENLKKRKEYFVRIGHQDLKKLHDTGNTVVSYSTAATGTVGELWVEYTIRFFTPQIEDQMHVLASYVYDSPTLAVPFDASNYDETKEHDNLSIIKPSTATDNKFYFQKPGHYIVEQICEGIGLTSWVLDTYGSAIQNLTASDPYVNSTGTKLVRKLSFDVPSSVSRSHYGNSYITVDSITGTSVAKAILLVLAAYSEISTHI
jgi:hypothetical protein